MKITLHQCHLRVGDIAANMPVGDGDTLHIWPELTLPGYMPDDLVRHADFVTACQALPRVGTHLFGTITKGTYNSAVLSRNGIEQTRTHKHHLPNYGVFDEKRIFTPGPLPMPIAFDGINLGVMICEDMWEADVAQHLKKHGADILIVINGSPYETNKQAQRLDIARQRVAETGLPLLYLNRTGGHDEVVYDGASFGLQANGDVAFQLPAFEKIIADIFFDKGHLTLERHSHESGNPDLEAASAEVITEPDALDYTAIVTGIRDYVHDNGFSNVLLGLSGGVDSALVARMAVDALGAEQVHCIGLPTRFTAQQSFNDAQALINSLGCSFEILPIEPSVQAMTTLLGDSAATGLTNENLQSRLRGVALMARSNATGALVLATGNKSEYAVGYSTLYGDMCGAYAPLKDVYKTRVYALCKYRGTIPDSILTRAPTAELRDGQTDQDSLPPYDVLDAVLEKLIEQEQSPADLIRNGFDAATVTRIAHLLKTAEYKRRQAAPGPKITRRAFGRDRRLPITNGYS